MNSGIFSILLCKRKGHGSLWAPSSDTFLCGVTSIRGRFENSHLLSTELWMCSTLMIAASRQHPLKVLFSKINKRFHIYSACLFFKQFSLILTCLFVKMAAPSTKAAFSRPGGLIFFKFLFLFLLPGRSIYNKFRKSSDLDYNEYDYEQWLLPANVHPNASLGLHSHVHTIV